MVDCYMIWILVIVGIEDLVVVDDGMTSPKFVFGFLASCVGSERMTDF